MKELASGCVALAVALSGAMSEQQTTGQPAVQVGRSKIATKYGIVAASQPLAARAGVQILERGGNAVDAAIATNAVMGLVEPHNNGIGGDLFAIYYEARTGKLYGLNAGGWAPTGLTPRIPQVQGHSRGCRAPASTRSPCRAPSRAGRRCARRFGKLPLSDLLAPAIFYAEDGFPVTDVIAACMAGRFGQACRRARTRRKIFLPNGRAPQAGEIFRNPAAGGDAATDRRERRRRLLRRQDRRRDPRRRARAGRHDDRRRSEGVPARVGRADLDDLSRLDGLRAAAEHAGHRRADDAEHDGAVSARRVRLPRARRRCT